MKPIPRPLLETLEERILYSADPGPAGLVAAVAGVDHQVRDATPADVRGTELVFVDSRSPDRQQLLDDFAAQQQAGRQLEVVVVDASDDGIGAISRSLEGRSDVSAIHIVGHGEAGSAQLGASRLDGEALLQRAGEIAAWGDALTPDADLLLYGCDVGATQAGRDLINGLAQLTGADVAASDDPTGSSLLGGDWQLEVQHGRIDTASITSAAGQARWQGLLNTYTVSNTADSGVGSLRQAIIDANANSGADSIDFAISGTGVHTISLSTILPTITGTVSIDATTDDSFAANGGRPAVVVNVNGHTGNGLTLAATADGSSIRGLVINNYTSAAIYINSGSDGNTIAGNYLGGLDASGNQIAVTSSSYTVFVAGANNHIGGSTAADRNVISPGTSGGYGILIFGAAASGNIVSGNYLATDASGNTAFSTSTTAVSIQGNASNNVIGGAGAGAGNVIASANNLPVYIAQGSGNVVQGNRIRVSASGTRWSGSDTGVRVDSGTVSILDNWIAGGTQGIWLNVSSGSVVQGNRIGTDLAGTANWGPSQYGILIQGSNNLVGGTGAGQGNIVANSNQSGGANDGIGVLSGTGNALLGNSIFGTKSASGALGIDLAGDGVTANDSLDADSGANNLQNYPVLSSIFTGGGNTTIVGNLNSDASTSYRIEFFSSPTAAASGHGEAVTYLGHVNVTTSASGDASFNTTLNGVVVPTGDIVTATATVDLGAGSFGSTSEFSANVVAVPQATITVTPTSGLVTTEAGGSAQFSVVLDSAPVADVVIALSVSNGAEGSLSASSLTFTSANWATPQTVTVTGLDDMLVDGSKAYSVITAAATSADPAYNGVNAADVSLTNTDNDSFNTIVVDTAADTADGNTSSLDALLADKGADGKVSLREAITAANNTTNGSGGADRINFGIAGTGAHTITLASALPTVTDAVVIDASTDDSFAANSSRPAIVINGGGGNFSGITLGGTADGSTVRGLVIKNLQQYGIEILAGSDGHTIAGNYIGALNADGTAGGTGNAASGIFLGGANNLIGGSTAADRNVISGNDSGAGTASGILVNGAPASGNRISGNYIGTSTNGLQASGIAQKWGIDLDHAGSGNFIGGSSAGERNVFGGNTIWGAIAVNATQNVSVVGNYIGVGADGTTAVPNQMGVFVINDTTGLRIGGTSAGEHNIIANSVDKGVTLHPGSTRAAVLGNSIYDNGGLGIDLEDDSLVQANDLGDGDSGANNLQNYPVLGSALVSGGSITITGSLNSNASTQYRIEFFSSPTADVSGHGEGLTYLGYVNVTTNASGDTSFNTTLTAAAAGGESISATATRANADFSVFSDTSEFSANILLVANTAPTITQGATTGMGAAYPEDSASAGFPVFGVIGAVNWSDPDAGAVRGMALTSTTGNGTWQYSTDLATWHDVGAVSGSNALLLSDSSWLRYVGDGANAENPTIQFRAWDMSSGTASTNATPSYVSPDAGGGTSAFSSQTANGFTVITGVNDAPVLTPASPVLAGISEDQTSHGGQTVASILGASVSDVDDGAQQGIAVVATTDGNGSWQFSTNDGASWSAVGVVSDGNALLLRAEDKIRFVPDGLNSTSASISYRAWDQSSGAAGSKADSSSNGGTTAFSVATDTASLTANAVNDTPVITSSATVSVAENTTAVLTVTATDVDLPAQPLSYSISGGADAALFQIDANTGALSFVSAPDFEVPTDAGGDNVYNVTVQVSDGAGGSGSQAIAVTVTPVNDNAPVITSSATASVTENNTAVLTVTATDADQPGQTLGYAISGGADAALFQIDANTGALSFVSAPDFEVPMDAGANNVYNVTVQVSDGAGGSTSQAIAVTVTPANDSAPVITSSASATVAENTTAVLTVTATDADLPAQTLSYSITGGADAAKFQIDANTGVLSFVSAPDFEVPTDAGGNNVYNVTVQVSDGAGGSTSQAIAVTVTPVNDNAPVITSSATASVTENNTSVLTVTATDADQPAQTLGYTISGGADAALFQIDANTGVLSFITAPDFEAPADAGANNVYNVMVQVSDGAGGSTNQAIAVTVTPVNDNAPVITSSATASVTENNTAVLTVTATDADQPAQTLSYTISGGADAALFQIDANTGVLSFITAPDFEAPADAGGNNVYNVTVQVSDGAGGSTSQAIAVTVTPANDSAPVITSSASATVAENTTAVLTVTATDADLPAQTLSYSITGGADAAKFQIDANTGALSFVSAPDFEVPTDAGGNNVYNVTVQVSDGAGGSTSQAIAVTVTPANDSTPVITSSASATVAENTTAVLTVTATDADLPTQTLSYSITGGADAAKFQIDANTGALSFVSAPDFEVPTDAGGNNVYNVTVQVSDGAGGTTDQAITVTVTGANDNAPVITSSATASVTENTTAVLTLTATDADLPAQPLSYTISGGADAALFQIDSNTGVLSFITAPDFEAPADAGGNNFYDVTLRVSDGVGGTTDQAITVTVTGANDNAPVITSSATASVTENNTAVLTVTATDADQPTQPLSYTISGGTDAALFQIDANTGALSFVSAPDFEVPTDAGGDNVYNVTVQVSDGAGGNTGQAIAVTVTPTNDNAPVITSGNTASVAENNTAVLTVTATDADQPAQTLSYTISGGTDAALFQIDANTGALSFVSAPDFEVPTDAGGDNVYNVTVQVSDGAGGSTSQAIAVTVTPANDSTPVITSSATASVTENTTAVLTVTATDADLPAQTLSYSISGGTDAALFQIDANTGALSFVSAPDFEVPTDAGGDNVYNVTVQVSDGAGGNTSQAIAVTVTPTNDNAPVITSGNTASVAENTTAMLTVTATDADQPGQTLSYAISGGADAALFQIDANTGALSFVSAPDFEVPTDAGGDNVYNVTVQVSDGAGGNTSQAIAVTVTPTNDNAPVITSGATASVTENNTAVLTVTATDADQPAQTLSYAITGGADAALFQIDANTGALSFVSAPDFEVPTDAGANNIYDVTVQVSDGAGGSTNQAITVTVTPVNDNAPVITSSATASITENNTAVLTVTATDADQPTQTLSYTITGGADAALFQIDANTGVLSFISAPDFEVPTDADGDRRYEVVLTVSDGNLGSSVLLTVSVADLGETPGGIDGRVSAREDEIYIFTASDLGLDPAAAQPLSVQITVLPSQGVLVLGGEAVAQGQWISQADIVGGRLGYLPPQDQNGSDYASFGFRLRDETSGLAGQGHSMVIDVVPLNDPPVLTTAVLEINRGGQTPVSADVVRIHDVDTSPGMLRLVVDQAEHGHFAYSTAPGTPVSQFSPADLESGRVIFVHDDSAALPIVRIHADDGQDSSPSLLMGMSYLPVTGATPTSPAVQTPPGAPAQEPQQPAQPPQQGVTPPLAPPAPPARPAAPEAASQGAEMPGHAGDGTVAPIPPASVPAPDLPNGRHISTVSTLRLERAQIVLTLGSNPGGALMEFLLSGEAPGRSIGSGGEGGDRAPIVTGNAPPALDDNAYLDAQLALQAVRMTGFVLSIGTIWWAIRASGLVASMLMAAPAWITFDPLPVLGPKDKDEPDWGETPDPDTAPDERNVEEIFEDVDERGAWS